MHSKSRIFLFLSIGLVVISLGINGYLGYQNHLLEEKKLALESELSGIEGELSGMKADFISTKESLETNIFSLQKELARTETERNNFEEKYIAEKNKMDFLASQIGGLQGQVGVLEKLNQTDPELLQKYSKIYFLNENYTPRELSAIESQYTFDPANDYLAYTKILPFFQSMLAAAEGSSIHLRIISAYRSFSEQVGLKSSYTMIYGSGANKFSADQGYSEHQLGTTFDFTALETGANYSAFGETTAYQWLLENAYKYGFILSYPENNQYYQFEPWHWRFIGRGLANELHQEGKNFYDLDQHEIDQYLISFFD